MKIDCLDRNLLLKVLRKGIAFLQETCQFSLRFLAIWKIRL